MSVIGRLDVRNVAVRLISDFMNADARIATAESCTGGLIAATLTDVPGSSAVFERGFVTYSNSSKVEMLGVPEDLIDSHGAVSEAVVRGMAEGALRRSAASVALAVTGIAGPRGGSPDKPVGLVHFGLASRTATHHRVEFFGDLGRDVIRWNSVDVAFQMLALWLRDQSRGAAAESAGTP